MEGLWWRRLWCMYGEVDEGEDFEGLAGKARGRSG